MDDFIHSLTTKNTETTTEEYFTSDGNHDFYDTDGSPRLKSYSDEKVYAKICIRQNNTKKFMIKVDQSNKFYNPFSLYDDKKAPPTFLNTIARNSKPFKEVSKSVFDLYIKFLVSKNSGWLLNAEREDE
jgi:hypothetical protein